MLILLIALSAYYGWRYSLTSVDPDWAYFNLRAFTGSLYGRDFADCKTPGVHLWYWLLSKLVGANVQRIKFANHFLVSLASIPVYYAAGFWPAVAFIVLVNSGWLMAFHGNVGQVPAALLVMAFVSPAPLAIVLWLIAVFYEPKLLPSLAVVTVLNGWYFLVLLVPLGIILYSVFRNQRWFKWVWESSVTIPKRIGLNRDGYNGTLGFFSMPWFTANGLLYLLPWVFLSAKPWTYWLAPLAFLLFMVVGKVVRPNHLIPVAAWIALSASPVVAMALCATDLLSSNLLLGNIWQRFYSSLDDLNADAKKVGEWLKDKAGVVYVNSIHAGIYIYSGKPVPFGFAEQIEIRENAAERREVMVQEWRKNPPDWVVAGEMPGINFVPHSYREVARIGSNVIYKKSL